MYCLNIRFEHNSCPVKNHKADWSFKTKPMAIFKVTKPKKNQKQNYKFFDTK